jgi:hypothetical protein
MEQKDLIHGIEAMKRQLDYWMEHGMKNCYMETLDMLDKAEDMLKNIHLHWDSYNRIQAVNFMVKSPEALKEIQDKKDAEDAVKRERERKEAEERFIRSREAQAKAREDLERRYMLAFMTMSVPSTMKNTDMIRALKRAPPISEEEARLNKRMAELAGLF